MTYVQHIFARISPIPSKQQAVHTANIILPSRNLIMGEKSHSSFQTKFISCQMVLVYMYVPVSTFRHSWLLISALFMFSVWLRPLPTIRISWSDLIRKLTTSNIYALPVDHRPTSSRNIQGHQKEPPRTEKYFKDHNSRLPNTTCTENFGTGYRREALFLTKIAYWNKWTLKMEMEDNAKNAAKKKL
jgi:hypothetical protein